MAESSQKKLDRVRKPRVHITYDVEIGDAIVKTELPFIIGVMGDFSGDPTAEIRPLKERKFTQIDVNTFDDVMKKVNAGLNLRVPNTMLDDGSEMAVQLKFESLDDFSPARVADQIEPLRKLLDTRQQLTELINKIDRSDDLGNLLESILTDSDALKKLSDELKLADVGGDGSDSKP
jgi:type VI secretion system protein ImpB